MSNRRTAQLEQVASRLRLEFREDDQWGLHTLLKDFHLFRQGRSRQISNMLFRPDPMLKTEVYLFDYYYRQGKGRAGDHRQTVFFAHSKLLSLPWFRMRPETLLPKILELFGVRDIDFEDHPEFSRNYFLTGPDEDYIRATMHEDVLRYFSAEKQWCLEGVNYYMILYRPDTLLKPEEVSKLFLKGTEVFRLLAASQEEQEEPSRI